MCYNQAHCLFICVHLRAQLKLLPQQALPGVRDTGACILPYPALLFSALYRRYSDICDTLKSTVPSPFNICPYFKGRLLFALR